jgi:hypothetical protein
LRPAQWPERFVISSDPVIPEHRPVDHRSPQGERKLAAYSKGLQLSVDLSVLRTIRWRSELHLFPATYGDDCELIGWSALGHERHFWPAPQTSAYPLTSAE